VNRRGNIDQVRGVVLPQVILLPDCLISDVTATLLSWAVTRKAESQADAGGGSGIPAAAGPSLRAHLIHWSFNDNLLSLVVQ
jgi:hypothetical protein